MTIYAAMGAHLNAALDALEADGALPAGLNRAAITLEPPRDASHGDMATNAAMVLAKPAGTNPRALAELLVAKLTALDEVTSADVAGPGFINLRLNEDAWRGELRAITDLATEYGQSICHIRGGCAVSVVMLIRTDYFNHHKGFQNGTDRTGIYQCQRAQTALQKRRIARGGRQNR